MTTDPPDVAKARDVLTRWGALPCPVDDELAAAIAVVLGALDAAVKERDNLHDLVGRSAYAALSPLSATHPSDCQACSENDEPCRTHAEDWRYWQAASEDMDVEYAKLMGSSATILQERNAAVKDRDTARALLERVAKAYAAMPRQRGEDGDEPDLPAEFEYYHAHEAIVEHLGPIKMGTP